MRRIRRRVLLAVALGGIVGWTINHSGFVEFISQGLASVIISEK
jgi:hypothetical protein